MVQQGVRSERIDVRSTAAQLRRSPHDQQMTSPSFIAIVDFATSAADRPAVIAQFAREQQAVRAMPGCVACRVFPSPENDTGITVLHEWTDRASFDDYLTSEAFARSGESVRPKMTGTPSSRRFRVELVETVA